MTDGKPIRCVPPRIDNHFRNTSEILLRDVGGLAGKTFRSVQIDSWEINIPNWSQTFLKDFRRCRGYDAEPYLAALSGSIVGQRRDHRPLPARLPQDAGRLRGRKLLRPLHRIGASRATC